MTIDEMIAVLEGAKEGKQVQFVNRKAVADWQPTALMWVDTRPVWNFEAYDYRLKPELREIWLSKSDLEASLKCGVGHCVVSGHVAQLYEAVKFREVLE